MATPPRPPVRVLSATLVLAAGLAFGPGATSRVIGPSAATPTPTPRLTLSGLPTPAPPPRDAPPRPVEVSVSQDEALRRREQLMRSPDFPRGTPFAYGPETRGVTVTVKGRAIKLPDDAYVVRVISTIECPAPRACPEPPVITLQRGASTLSLSERSGAVVHQEIAPGEEDAFRFLRDALR